LESSVAVFVDRSDHTFQWNGDPATLSEEQRRALEDHMISRAINRTDPLQIETARKQIEAEASQALMDVEAVPT